jgi:hypothetical protein
MLVKKASCVTTQKLLVCPVALGVGLNKTMLNFIEIFYYLVFFM